ncbi:MAG: sensor histidine kinase [Ignavibacteriales bacterium]|nr:sensor histidine kinase [Ignavibacteriales bacterium]
MEPTNIFDFFFSLENPAIYGLIIILLLSIIIILIKQEYIKPLNKQKSELEVENTKLMALFAEIDPDPILRVDSNNIIISANNSALNYFKSTNLIGSEFTSIIPNIDLTDEKTNSEKVIKLNSFYFNISVRKIESLGFKQIYLHDITRRIEYEEQIEKYQKSLRQLRTRLEKYNESEKQRLGKELHDSIGQNISLIKIELQKYISLEKNLNNKDSYYRILELIDILSDEVREISHQLRPRILNEFGLFPAISSLIDSVNKNSEIKGTISTFNQDIYLDQNFEINIYRICQEAIHNIVKHSECSNFFIQFLIRENDLILVISDDGKGFDTENYLTNGISSLGLLNLKERVSNFEGNINIESQPNEGTTIFITFPNIYQWS